MAELHTCCHDEVGSLREDVVDNELIGESVSPDAFLRPYGVPQHVHTVQFYSHDEFLLDELGHFIGTALGGGNVAVVIATEAHRDGLAHRLRLTGFDPATAIRQGRYMPLDAADTLATFMVDGLPDAQRFHRVLGEVIAKATAVVGDKSSRLVAFGEMVALLWAEGKAEAAIQLEQLWNELAQKYAFSLRCAYPLAGFNRTEHADVLLKICAEHSAVIPEESYTELGSESDRLRAVAQLQQKARALETEMSERVRIHKALLASGDALRRSHHELERRVQERTRELIEAQTALRELSGRLLTMRDEERRRLARELHDSTGQTLAAIQMNLTMLQVAGGADLQASRRLAETIDLADQAMKEIRTLSYLLHPPMLDEAGLLLAMEWYVSGFVERTKIKVDLELPAKLDRLPHAAELAIFRIVQEALGNVQRHSGSHRARVRLTLDNNLIEVVVEDFGKGVPDGVLSGKTGVGINGMRERARLLGGELKIQSSSSGTCIKVQVPLPSNESAGWDTRLTAI